METGTRSKNILDRIVEARRESVAHRKRVLPEVALKIAVEKKIPPPRDFASALTRNGINIIAELKKVFAFEGPVAGGVRPGCSRVGLGISGCCGAFGADGGGLLSRLTR